MSNKPDLASAGELELDWGSREQRAPGHVPEPAGEPLPEEPSGAGKGLPGDPRYMSRELRLQLTGLLEGPGLRMRQLRELVEVLVPWEARNQYEVCDDTGRPTVYVGETGDGWGSALKRNFWPFYKARMECMTLGGTVALAIERPWSFLLAHANVEAWDGRLLGRIEQRFSVVGRKLELLTPSGTVLATVEGPLLKPWTFRVMQRGVEVALIRKKWNGVLQELFTDADTFRLDFAPECTDGRLRQLILGAALLVDMTWFDNRSSSSIVGPGADLLDIIAFWK
ncbi:phospholipid scramblase family protein [Pyxidicoccus xibeiensis]|uniref:phospholipid scramblase family protein n=1 Tax=Pyxidicoccus xibeiensis TaxID=2906759 RepID=UPI0020A7EB8E|nr:phospholipid scramblase family protein [Pyxidicoccus xibeiensis]MCP3136925.1 scramblase [Pyxidicoccus xibeiensis]